MGIDSVGDLNDTICDGQIHDMILVQEALQERRIGEIAKEIVEKGNVKFVLIAASHQNISYILYWEAYIHNNSHSTHPGPLLFGKNNFFP